MLTENEKAVKAQVEAVKEEWKAMWSSRIDDKVVAEGIANGCFKLLSVDRGVVIAATRDFRQLDLREILRSYVSNVDQAVSPPPSVGGWRKFAKTVVNNQSRVRKTVDSDDRKRLSVKAQAKKSGRGWVHNF